MYERLNGLSKAGSIVVTCCLLLLAGCATVPPQVLAPNTADREAKQFSAPHGQSRVYLFHGSWRTCGLLGCIDQKINFPIGFYIDGLHVGNVPHRSGYLLADVAPGKHVFQWKDMLDGPDVVQGDTEILLENGRTYYIRVKKGTGAELMFGLVGAMAVRPTGQIENVGDSGKAEILEKSLLQANQDTLRRLADVTGPSEHVGSSPASASVRDKLVQLKGMFEQGLITKDEYDSKRKQLLEKMN